MIVPKRVYKDVVYPKIALDDIKQMNRIVGDFYNGY